MLLAICYLISDALCLKLAITRKNLFSFARCFLLLVVVRLVIINLKSKYKYFYENIFSVRKCAQFSQLSKYDQKFSPRWSMKDPLRYL